MKDEQDSLKADIRTILSVVGPHSGSGKTLFVIHLFRHVAPLGCLKISPVHDQAEGDQGDEEQTQPGFFLEDRSRITRLGKDTALYLAAGAAQVERLRHKPDALASGLEAALKRFPPALPLVVESSSAAKLLDPAAIVLVARPPIREMKPATTEILSRVTDLLVNVSEQCASGVVEAKHLLERFPALQSAHVYWADLAHEPPPAEMLQRLQTLLQQPRQSLP